MYLVSFYNFFKGIIRDIINSLDNKMGKPPLPIPVTLVPCPALSCGPGSEVGAAQVHDAGGEAQQAAVAVGPVHPGGRRGQAVLLVGAGQQVQRPVLQVGCLLHQLGVQDQVWGRCGQQDTGTQRVRGVDGVWQEVWHAAAMPWFQGEYMISYS